MPLTGPMSALTRQYFNRFDLRLKREVTLLSGYTTPVEERCSSYEGSRVRSHAGNMESVPLREPSAIEHSVRSCGPRGG